MATFGTLVSALAVIVTTAIAVLKYLSRRDKQIAARSAFQAVVNSLSSETEIQRLSGAILLRRFFDPQTELGEGGTPYAREAMYVIAAILREAESGNFQKLLADGLRFAPSLERVDLQRTNLQKAYLGRKGDKRPNLTGADFFRADLSGASLKGAEAAEAQFYGTRLHNTVLKETNLARANFFEADLLGANFVGASLSGANFSGARNIPADLLQHIGNDGIYASSEPVKPAKTQALTDGARVFLSKPNTLNAQQRQLVNELTELLTEEGIEIATVEREDYPGFGAVSEVRRVMTGCAGVVVLGFRQLEIRNGTWRGATEETQAVDGMALPTAWNHVEAGMAAMAGLPTLFLVEQGVIGGLFELEDIDHVVTKIDLQKPDYGKLRESVTGWCRSVRETLR